MWQTLPGQNLSAGAHTIKYWMVDPGVVLQKIVLKKNDVDPQSYLGLLKVGLLLIDSFTA
jgi:hypothetical protein